MMGQRLCGRLNNAEELTLAPAVSDFCHFLTGSLLIADLSSLLIANHAFGQFEVADCF